MSAAEPEDDTPTAPFWMTTFSDLMTLLMTFFVMIVAMSEVEVQKFKKALSHFQQGAGVMPENASLAPAQRPGASQRQFQSRRQARQYRKLTQYLEDHDLEDKVQANLTKNGIHVIIADSVMFRTGEAHLIEPSRTILKMLSTLIDEDVRSVTVEGHTDDRPIHTGRFPSNWELSTARAASAVRFLQGQTPALDPSRYAAVGYGSYRPRDTTASALARARNRRVEILFNWRSWKNKKPPQTKTPNPL